MMSNSVDDTLIKINKIQKEWSDGIISIGKAHLEKKSVLSLTENFLDKLYQFDSKILFKPTKASKIQFRRNKNEFLYSDKVKN